MTNSTAGDSLRSIGSETQVVIRSGCYLTHDSDLYDAVHQCLLERLPLAVGGTVGLGVSHPCLTFDKWPANPIVDHAYDVVSMIRTYV